VVQGVEVGVNHWVLMFRPATYQKVKEHSLIGVTSQHYKRIEAIAPGDKFVVYVSQQRILDGRGEFTSASFIDTTAVFGVREDYPCRARVRFDQTGANRDGKDALWGLAEFAQGTSKTTPSNMLFCRGGFMKITPEDYDYLCQVLEGTWRPPETAS
jgi:hypothetical protein